MKGKHILVGVSGGIAAIKIPLLVRELRRNGAEVKIIMTKAAREFVTPLSLSTVSNNPVITETFPQQHTSLIDASTWHINLAEWADAFLLAPATANTIAKIANGIADDALTTLTLALRCPLIISPTMDGEMWSNTATQRNIATLREEGCFIIPPEVGELASGLTGVGRLPEIPALITFLNNVLHHSSKDFSKKKILITAGPTYEAIDPVRFIGNRSSGKMGFAFANAASLRGADVTLISGPTHLLTPRNVKRVNIETAEEMFNAVKAHSKGKDVIIMSAAVADFTPAKKATQKIKKESLTSGNFTIEVEKTTDILSYLGREKKKSTLLIGFALETENMLANARKKLKAKNLDIIICNNPLEEGAGFSVDTNRVTVITSRGKEHILPLMTKFEVANEILSFIAVKGL